MGNNMTPAEAARRAKIVAHYELATAKLYKKGKAPKALKPPAKTVAGVADDQPHLDKQAAVQGNLYKGKVSGKIDASYYAYNGWNYIALKRKGTYDSKYKGYAYYSAATSPNFNPEYKRKGIKDSEVKKALERLDDQGKIGLASRELLRRLRGQARRNGNTGQSIPYPYDAHHILPMEAFYKNLRAGDIEIIQKSDYDINSGQNMIFLPASMKTTWFHNLPAHVDNHPKSTAALKSKFDQLKDSIDSLRSENKPHKAMAKASAKMLHTFEDQQFKLIAKMGAVRLQ